MVAPLASTKLPLHRRLVRAIGQGLALALIALPMLLGGKAQAASGEAARDLHRPIAAGPFVPTAALPVLAAGSSGFPSSESFLLAATA